MRIIDDDTFIFDITRIAGEFFSVKNLFRGKTPQNLTEYLIDKFFNSQRVLSVEHFQKNEEKRLEGLSSF